MAYRLGKLIPLVSDLIGVAKTSWHYIFMRRATLIRIIDDLDCIIEAEKAKKQFPIRKGMWITTDNMGSGFDTRYTHISWMDTR